MLANGYIVKSHTKKESVSKHQKNYSLFLFFCSLVCKAFCIHQWAFRQQILGCKWAQRVLAQWKRRIVYWVPCSHAPGPPSRCSRILQRGGDSHTSVRLFKGVGCWARVEKGPSAAKVCIRSNTGRGPVDTWAFRQRELATHVKVFLCHFILFHRLGGSIAQIRRGVSQDRDGDHHQYANDTTGAGSVPLRTHGQTARVRSLQHEPESKPEQSAEETALQLPWAAALQEEAQLHRSGLQHPPAAAGRSGTAQRERKEPGQASKHGFSDPAPARPERRSQ